MQRRSFLLASAAALSLSCPAWAKPLVKGLPPKRIAIDGARAPIEIVEDELGVPHIRAQSKHDAFFGQGYVVARDRMFQIDWSYRRNLGRMAEVLGPRFVAADRAERLFLYHGDVDAELASLPADVLDCARGYVAGVNARIAELEADPTLLPAEYRALGMTPLRWDVRDLIRIRNPSSGNTDDEIRRCQLETRGLLAADNLMEPIRPQWTLKVPEGLDVAAVSPADLGTLAESGKPLPLAYDELALYDRHYERVDLAGQGSNAWTVAGSRTATGRPILANDPHLGIGGFNPRHVVHMSAPGLDVVGGGNPGLPGIMQGHTDRFAFGRTNFHIDQSDLFILKTHPDDPEKYWHNGVWKSFETAEEQVVVKGAAPETVKMRFAGGRPIISADPARQRAVALASVNLLPGANGQFSMIAINLSHDWASLKQAFKLHTSPTNFHYADIDGNTGWQTIGFVPRRPRHDGLFPAPGDGSYDWQGILPVDEMPSSYNPKEGWFATANQMNIPADYPYQQRNISFTWSDSYRYDRCAEVLRTQPRHRVADSIALQHDVQSHPARAIIALLPAKPSVDAAQATALLKRWNAAIDADSPAALLYEMVIADLLRRFWSAAVPFAAQDLVQTVNLSEMLRILSGKQARDDDPQIDRDALINESLAAGWKRAVELAGPNPAKWRWGDLHRVVVTHPLSRISAIAKAFPKIEGGRSGGDGYTVMARGVARNTSTPRGFQVIHGASFLFVADVGAWDNSRYLLLPGQSADPSSPYYSDFYPKWLAGAMQPMWFSRAAVDEHAVGSLILQPKGAG